MDWAALASRIVVPKGRTNRLQWDGRPGHFEVWYLTLNAGQERLGLWLRYALRAPLEAPPYREVWAHVFDAARPEKSFGVRRRLPWERWPGPHEIFSGPGALLEENRAQGRVEGEGHAVEWELAFDADPCSAFLTPAPLRALQAAPSTLVLANPDARFRGTATVDGRALAVDREPGGQAHLWGQRHLERWVWGRCSAFAGRDDCALEGVAAYPRLWGREVGPLTAVYVRYRGLDYCLSALPRLVLARSRVDFPSWQFEGAARSLRFCGTFGAPAERFLQIEDGDPDGRPSRCCNTEVADLALEISRGARVLDRLEASGTAHLEFGSRHFRPGVRASV